MTLLSAELKEGVQKLFETWSSPGAKTVGPTVAETKLIGPQTSEAKWPNFDVTSDEPKSVGGMDSAPPPSSLFVASIGFAENVIFARQAALRGVDFDSYATKVEGTWDRKGIFGIEDADPAITRLLIETRVGTTASPQEIIELLKLTHQRSPMTATVAKAAKIERKLFVNGIEVPV
jgi:uncharacterized OsmC-like protein